MATFAAANAASEKDIRLLVSFERDRTVTEIHDLDDTTDGTVSGYGQAASPSYSSTEFLRGSASYTLRKTGTAGTDFGCYCNALTVAVDATSAHEARMFAYIPYADKDDIASATLILYSSSGTTDYYSWTTTSTRAGWKEYRFDLTAPDATGGTFDIADITGFKFGFDTNENADTVTYCFFDDLAVITYGDTLPSFSNGDVQNATTATIHSCVVGVGKVVGKVEPGKARSSAAGTSITLLDKGQAVTSMCGTYEMRNRIATISLGYAEVDEADYEPMFKGQITGLRYDAKRASWVFSVGDLRRSLKKTIFTTAASTAVTYTGVSPIALLLRTWMQDSANGMGVHPDYVDTETILQIEDDYFSARTMDFDIREPWEGKAFTEEQLAGPLGAYVIIDGSGRLSMRYITAPLWADRGSNVLNESNIIGVPQLQHDLRDLLNEVYWKLDYDAATDAYSTKTLDIDSDSVTLFQQSKSITIESQGMDNVSDGAFVSTRNDRIFDRFADPYPRYKVRCKMSCSQLTEGELVELTHPALPDMTTGERGVYSPRLCEVISVSIDTKRGVVDVELLDTPWSFTRSVVVSTLAFEYEHASSTQKDTYGWIGRTSDNQVDEGGGSWVAGYVILDG